MFTKSIAHRDDWLHRGEGLRDMASCHYARFIESVEKPTKGTAQGVQQRHPVYYLFDHHYTLANRELQVLLKRPKTVQNIGPQRKRSDLNKGEDNAVYKAYFHSCIQCAGADDCVPSLRPATKKTSMGKPWCQGTHLSDLLRWMCCSRGRRVAEVTSGRPIHASMARRCYRALR